MTAARLALLASLGIASAACDAGATWRAHLDVRNADGAPVTNAMVRSFWFDPDDVDPLEGDLEEVARQSAEERGSRPSWGNIDRKWKQRTTDASGRVEQVCHTFYAGALLLPLHRLVFGSIEDDPSGLWIQVQAPSPPAEPLVEFLVLPTEDGFAPFLVHRTATGARTGDIAGSFGQIEEGKGLRPSWVVVVRLPPPSGPAR